MFIRKLFLFFLILTAAMTLGLFVEPQLLTPLPQNVQNVTAVVSSEVAKAAPVVAKIEEKAPQKISPKAPVKTAKKSLSQSIKKPLELAPSESFREEVSSSPQPEVKATTPAP